MFENDMEYEDIRLITTKELGEAMRCSHQAAVEFGEAAGARIQLGRSVRWRVKDIREHMDRVQKGAAS